jgi:2-keto-4-pentenoate hydratase/2-oxohepta-3-ene-1,7-dioic acid hydratase in catechol pathway
VKLAVFDDYRIGVVEDETLRDVTRALPTALDAMPELRMNWLIANWSDLATQVARFAGPSMPVSSVRLRACSPAPRHIFALPANFREHVGEIGLMSVSGTQTADDKGFFLKAPGSLAGASETILLPRASQRRFDHECEIALIVGATAFDVPAARARDVVFGYACAVDVTMRIDPAGRQEDRSLRKSFASFTPLGPYMVTADEIGDPHELTSRLSVNGSLRQRGHAGAMIVDMWRAIELISSVVPLQPGDVVLTGTPSGVGPIVDGDVVEITVDRVGTMRLPVAERPDHSPRAI